MIRDQLYKLLFIPVAGAAFPFLAGLFSQPYFSGPFLLLTIVYFIAVVFVGWQGVVKLTAYLHENTAAQKPVFLKLVQLSLGGAMYAAVVFVLATAAWQAVALSQPVGFVLGKAALIGAAGGLLLALIYKVVFLSLEKEQDNRVLQQIDFERQQAEIDVLKNELDPHFFFNCMNTLSHLVRNDTDKAYHFVHKLSSVYKYFLRNKEKEYVPLHDEVEFLDNYYFLLRIRYDDNVRIAKSLNEESEPVFILPCSLQVLVENAIKHNFFSEKEPLEISIEQNGAFIVVSNPVRPKLHAVESTWVGLRNLKARYRLLTNQNVVVQKTANRFLVKLPNVKTISHDKSSDY
jgi:two-component system, LytTR family, sensor kinase